MATTAAAVAVFQAPQPSTPDAPGAIPSAAGSWRETQRSVLNTSSTTGSVVAAPRRSANGEPQRFNDGKGTEIILYPSENYHSVLRNDTRYRQVEIATMQVNTPTKRGFQYRVLADVDDLQRDSNADGLEDRKVRISVVEAPVGFGGLEPPPGRNLAENESVAKVCDAASWAAIATVVGAGATAMLAAAVPGGGFAIMGLTITQNLINQFAAGTATFGVALKFASDSPTCRGAV